MAPLKSYQECSPAEALHTSQGGRSFGAHRTGQVHNSDVWFLASWNVRTLLDVEGPVDTARQGDDVHVEDERKIDQVVDELGRYYINVAALQETKWFGENVYKVGESVVLAAGRPVPGRRLIKQRGEGVAIVLSGAAVNAWKWGGCQWKAWSSRLVSVTLRVGVRKSDCLHVLSCYAPTYANSREEKNNFLESLQQAISGVPPEKYYVMLGDFNARVGSRVGSNNEWWYERGPFGYGILNEAGRA